eukprot:11247591-Alexandrium_andersonii.AAC.1
MVWCVACGAWCGEWCVAWFAVRGVLCVARGARCGVDWCDAVLHGTVWRGAARCTACGARGARSIMRGGVVERGVVWSVAVWRGDALRGA